MEYMGFKKFKDGDRDFHKNIQEMINLNINPTELIHHFPIFTGHVNLARYLFFYDLYKKCYELSGNIADVGTWKGPSFFYMAKLVRLFESYSTTQVHGFDWFKGMEPDPLNDDISQAGLYNCNYDELLKLISMQNLQDVAILHKLDLTKDLEPFFNVNSHLRFKMVFIDCGIKEVLEKALQNFWPKLVYGGILIMDHYNAECSPSESATVEMYTGKNLIRHIPFTRQPTAYIIKES